MVLGIDQLCVGDTATINSGPISCSWPNTTYEWIINREDQWGNYKYYSTVIQPNGPLYIDTLRSGKYRFSLNVRSATSFNTIIALPALRGARAEIRVYGPNEPDFTIDHQSCSFDPTTGMYTTTISIHPEVDLYGDHGAGVGTTLDIDWGDGNTNRVGPLFPSSNYQPITHTYQYHHASSPGTFAVEVVASGYCADKTVTKYFSPVYEYYDVQFEVIEEDCDRHIVCVSGLPSDVEIGLYGPNGEPGTFTDCLEFWQPGPYYIVINTSGGCPQVVTYNPTFAVVPGILSSPDAIITPGQSLNLNLGNPQNGYVAYEVLAQNCYGAPDWLLFNYGPASAMNNFVMPPPYTGLIKPCFLTDNFEVCIRARVFCSEEEMWENYANGTPGPTSNTICLPLCMVECESSTGGGGGDNPGEWLQEPTDTDLKHQQANQTMGILMPAELHIFPNPTNGQFSIELENFAAKETVSIAIVDLQGRTIQVIDNIREQGSKLNFDLSGQPAGMYQVILKDKTSVLDREPIILIE